MSSHSPVRSNSAADTTRSFAISSIMNTMSSVSTGSVMSEVSVDLP
jgi:hypothetical protein